MAVRSGELIEQFKNEAVNAGATVFVGESDAAADYILKIAAERNVRCVVKSRSPLAGEMALSARLEGTGAQVIESGIREWLNQLAARESVNIDLDDDSAVPEVAELLSGITGKRLEPDLKILVQAANAYLRPYYLRAGMGISEAAAGIAETGTVIITGNEGDERLATVLPGIHITLISSDNLTATMEEAVSRIRTSGIEKDAPRFPRYVTYLTGRNTTGDIPGALTARAQGPEEEHVVVVNKAEIR